MSATPAPPPPAANDPLAFLPRQDRHKPKCGPVRKSKMGKRRMWVLVAVHVLIGVHIVWWLVTGSAITPVEPSEAMQTIELGLVNAGFLLFVALILSTLVFGRWFCGWACHVVALQDASAWLLGRIGVKPRPIRSRLLVLAPWVVAGHMFFWEPFRAWMGWREQPLPRLDQWQSHLTTTELWATFPGPLMGVLTFVVVGFLVVWWMGAKGFCTHGCPYGAFFAVADRVAPMRIKVTDACDGCGHCTNVCTSNVRVHEEVAKHKQLVDPGCMKCLDCVSVCPKEALYVGFAAPKPFAVSQQRIQARADFTWPEELLLAAVALFTAQWVFRGAWFGEGIPFLMAVGLGVITAVFALLLVRLLGRRDVTFQHTVLKAQGKRTRAGRWALLGLGAWLVFTAHTFVVRQLRESALAAAQAPLNASFYGGPRDAQQSSDALAQTHTAVRWALLAEPKLLEVRALLHGANRAHADAEQQLRALQSRFGGFQLPESSLALASYCVDAKPPQLVEARRLVAGVLAKQPNNPVARFLDERVRKAGG
jgi:polyferredoxin